MYVYMITCVAAGAGLLFGFDVAVVAGAIPFFTKYFSLTPFELGLAVSNVSLGCLFGSGIAGFLSDKWGRKWILFASAILFLISAILSTLPESLVQLIIARFIGGWAIGISSPIAPIYIAEIAPPRIRGRLVTINQLTITLGFMLAYASDWIIAGIGTEQWRQASAWRWMFGFEVVPASIFAVVLLFVPESPRWLIKQNLIEKARHILTRIEGEDYATSELLEIENTVAHEESSFGSLFRWPFKKAITIGVFLAVFSQINALAGTGTYTTKILLDIGFKSESAAMLGMVFVGLALFVSTIFVILFIDKIRRRTLIVLSAAGLLISGILLGAQFYWNIFSNPLVLFILLFGVVSYALGIGPGTWLVISEIFPTRLRGRATAVCTVFLWLSSFVILWLFPIMQEISQSGTFWFLSFITVIGGVISWFIIPETKGKTLEQIEEYWRSR